MLGSLATFLVQAQEPKPIPDGTEGEFHPAKDSVVSTAKKQPWNQFDLGFTTFRIGAGFLYEFATFSQNAEGIKQADTANFVLEPVFKVRDFRFFFSGVIRSKRTITWKVGLMYDGPSHSWLVRETGLMVEVPEIRGHLFVGRTKEGFSLNKVMNGYAGWTMERQIAIDVIPILADGIKWLGYLPKQGIIWNIGAYTNWLSEKQSFSTFDWQVAARVAWLPIHSPADKKLLHIGTSLRYAKPLNGKIRLRSRPEAFPAPYFLDTESFQSDHSTHIGGEAYYTSGPLMLGSEVYMHRFNSPEKGDPSFHGGEVVASYFLTGESRPYTTVSGIYSFVPVNKSVFKGGPGAVELLLRYSRLDLDDAQVNGGKFWRLTPMINWYISPIIRLEFAYGYGVLERYGLKGATQFFQSRIQIVVM